MRKIILISFVLVLSIFAQTLEPPVDYDITSDFGARNLSKYDWHKGIDYGSPMWTEIEAVEGGNINFIHSSEDGDPGGWRIRIDGDSLSWWTYMHLFEDGENPISPDSSWEAVEATLEDPSGQNNPEDYYTFIHWIDRENNIASEVLSSRGFWWVQWNGDYIRDENGDILLTSGSLGDRDTLGLSGNSGAGGVHLHLSAGSNGYTYDLNPLYHIGHDNPAYNLYIGNPSSDEVMYHVPGLPEKDQEHERIEVNVNSTAGLDLDRVYIYFFDTDEPHSYDENHLFGKIIYGGLPPNLDPEGPYPQSITNEGEESRGSETKTGIDPQTDVCGNDDFHFNGGFSEDNFAFSTKINEQGTGEALVNNQARFKDGRKDMVVRALSIKDSSFTAEKSIILDNFAPFVEEVVVSKDGDVRYDGRWELNGQQKELLSAFSSQLTALERIGIEAC